MSAPEEQTQTYRAPEANHPSWNKLNKVANDLTLQRNLSDDQLRRLRNAKDVLWGVHQARKKKRYQAFLRDALQKGGPQAVLVCAIAVSQQGLADMRNADRDAMVEAVERNKDNPSLKNSALQRLASYNGMPNSLEDLFNTIEGRELARCEDETQYSTRAVDEALSNPSFPATTGQRVFENASMQGIAKVFDDEVCGAIRRRTIQGTLKAAVTMAFPRLAGPVDCLMSLDICEKDVEKLAMALFGAKILWVEEVLHIILDSGFKLTIPNSEATLKGVPDENIVKVFGSEIHDAVTATPVRRRELKEGKRVTECMSMIFTKTGAIINVFLGLEGGVEIQNKLYR